MGVDSRKLEYGPETDYAGFPSSLAVDSRKLVGWFMLLLLLSLV